jgi:DNA-binding Lrp family transcriptional regulator
MHRSRLIDIDRIILRHLQSEGRSPNELAERAVFDRPPHLCCVYSSL